MKFIDKYLINKHPVPVVVILTVSIIKIFFIGMFIITCAHIGDGWPLKIITSIGISLLLILLVKLEVRFALEQLDKLK